MELLRKLINTLLALGLVAAGGAAAVWLMTNRPAPNVRSSFQDRPSVAVLAVLPRTESSPVVGYGTVRPKNQVNIIPQVSGRLVFTHEDLAQGKVIPEGELLFEIDQTIYDARMRQAEAEVRGLESSLNRHRQEMEALEERIATARELLGIQQREYETQRKLFEVENVGRQSDVDLYYQKYLQQKDVVAELETRRAVGPHLEGELEAKLDASRARVAQAKHDLESTSIDCPFRARVESVGAYRSQVVTAHLSIATLTDMEAFELSIGIDPRELRWLDDSIRPNLLEEPDGEPSAEAPTVRVAWSLPGSEFVWEGYVTRFERVDEATRTARLVVEVRDFEATAGGTAGGALAPDLAIGMHCRTDLPAEPLRDALMVPRHAIHENRWVYVFEPDSSTAGADSGRLGRREVPLLRSLGEYVLVDYAGRSEDHPCELRPGEQVVVSPLATPIVGMAVRSREVRVTGEVPRLRVAERPRDTLSQALLQIRGTAPGKSFSLLPLPQ